MKIQRRILADVLTRDGETAVVVTGRVVRLSDLSALVFALTENPVEVEDLARALEAELGAPEGRSTLDATKDAVSDLIRHGVLRPSEQPAQ